LEFLGAETGTWVNWAVDTLFINEEASGVCYINSLLDNAVLQNCKQLAMTRAVFSAFSLPTSITNLETLIIMLNIEKGKKGATLVPPKGPGGYFRALFSSLNVSGLGHIQLPDRAFTYNEISHQILFFVVTFRASSSCSSIKRKS